MLDNGTVMNGKMIESPKSFEVACIVTTQIIATVASNQYGGQSVDMIHLGKYLRKSYDKYRKEMQEKYRDKFQKLIQSVETEGFRADSKLLVDKDLFLEDGAHRIGLLFYKGTLEATVKCVWRVCFYQWKFDGYCHSEFPPQMFEDILQECTRMQQTFLERGYSFVLWISGGEESEIWHLLFGLTPFIDVYKTYAVASNATQYDGGNLVQFTPKNLEYAVTRKGYYAKNVKRMESILSKRIANLGWNQRFAISQNCLEGHTMMETVQDFLKEVV